MLGSLILYLKGMRIMMFQLSGFYCKFKGAPKGSHVPFSADLSPGPGPCKLGKSSDLEPREPNTP